MSLGFGSDFVRPPDMNPHHGVCEANVPTVRGEKVEVLGVGPEDVGEDLPHLEVKAEVWQV